MDGKPLAQRKRKQGEASGITDNVVVMIRENSQMGGSLGWGQTPKILEVLISVGMRKKQSGFLWFMLFQFTPTKPRIVNL